MADEGEDDEGEAELKPLAFFGHFTGASSYPYVSKSIARWLRDRVELTIVNLREGKTDAPDLAPLQRSPDTIDSQVPVLLFGFPSHLVSVSRFHKVTGYHVGDVNPMPLEWGFRIVAGCDRVLTPSRWSKTLIDSVVPDVPGRSGNGMDVRVVRHGVDTRHFYFKPRERQDRVVLRHFCSSPTLERKGTSELIRAARQLLYSDGDPFVLVVSAPPEALRRLSGLRSEGTRGRIVVIEDEPKGPDVMAQTLWETDVLVQPSRAEGFGLTPLEAAACGRPVVTTRVTGHEEWFASVERSCVEVETGDLRPCSGGAAPELIETSLVDALDAAIGQAKFLLEEAETVASEVQEDWSWGSVLKDDFASILPTVLV